jgi:hypothetical protein
VRWSGGETGDGSRQMNVRETARTRGEGKASISSHNYYSYGPPNPPIGDDATDRSLPICVKSNLDRPSHSSIRPEKCIHPWPISQLLLCVGPTNRRRCHIHLRQTKTILAVHLLFCFQPTKPSGVKPSSPIADEATDPSPTRVPKIKSWPTIQSIHPSHKCYVTNRRISSEATDRSLTHLRQTKS